MRNAAIASLMVVATLAGAGVGYLVGMNTKNTLTTPTTTFTICQISAEGEVLLQVMNGTSGRPIPSAPIEGQFTPIPCGSNPQTTITLNTTLTNATGYALFGYELGEYHLTVYAYGNYFVDASTLPEKTTCATLSIPSGETVIRYSATFQSTC